MVVCGLNECEASARPQSFVVVEQIWRADPNSLSRDRPTESWAEEPLCENAKPGSGTAAVLVPVKL